MGVEFERNVDAKSTIIIGCSPRDRDPLRARSLSRAAAVAGGTLTYPWIP